MVSFQIESCFLMRSQMLLRPRRVLCPNAGSGIWCLHKRHTAGPDTDIAQIARVLYEEHVGSLPIIDDSKNLVGMITRSDIFKAIVEGGLRGG
ncbi:MAG: hypothetical protein CME19_01670 [Gemmatimonadetes bacterium]|nr:hypothetical protein [Gemmatimonadota bacterium]|tara:strand:- start:463 stop:741 length:279 start_codon:yes stop_codon:yes gene_type:complete